jgi:CRISPR-associated protein Cas2
MVSKRPKRAKPDQDGTFPSGYQWMWLFAMFDLPIETKEMRREYARFRTFLLSQGFSMLQLSVYARHCPSEESGEGIRRRVGESVPPHGQVRLLLVTDRQFGKMEVYFGKNRRPAEEPPSQLMLF